MLTLTSRSLVAIRAAAFCTLCSLWKLVFDNLTYHKPITQSVAVICMQWSPQIVKLLVYLNPLICYTLFFGVLSLTVDIHHSLYVFAGLEAFALGLGQRVLG